MSEMLTRGFPMTPTSFDPEARTFECVMTAGSDVRRRDARGTFWERLDISGIDPTSLVGLPVLDGHRQSGSENIIGSIIAARQEAGAIVGTVQLSAADDVRNVMTKIAEGNIKAVSIGYGIQSKSERAEQGERIVTIKPAIRELSVVVIGADPLARIRTKEHLMPDQTPPAENDNPAQTRAEIRAIARSAGMTAEWADEQIDAGADLVTVRAAAFEAMQSRQSPTIRTHTAAANDDPAVILERRADALFARINGSAPDDAARQYYNDGMEAHARAILALRGQSVAGMAGEQIIRAAMHTTSDFSNLLTGVGNRTLMSAYQVAQSPLKRVARQAVHSDFRTASRLKLGDVGQLREVTEAGEIKSTTRGEAAESYALKTYGSKFELSRKAMINDDLGALRDWGIAAGRAAAETESAVLWALLAQSSYAGPVMGEDGKRLFHADHGNLAASGGAIADATLSAARLALRTMKGLDGKTPIAATPKFLLVGPALETTAEKLLASIAPATSSDVNPFAGKLELLVEPRLAGNAWYVFTDPAQLAVLEYAYLSSAQGPQMASREGWDVLGMEFRVTLDFGCGAVDYRGAYRNAGA
ncbi:prohead protease/major capsid protein fusion protein [Sphingobium sp. TomTYG45]